MVRRNQKFQPSASRSLSAFNFSYLSTSTPIPTTYQYGKCTVPWVTVNFTLTLILSTASGKYTRLAFTDPTHLFQNDYMDEHRRRHGRRMDHEERK